MGFFVNLAKSRTRRGKNWLAAFIGPPRSGKSWGAAGIAEDISPRFNKDTVESNICFTADQFIQLLNSGKLQSGDVIIIDEAGTSISAREYWEKANRIILGVLQTFGYLHLNVFFVVPYITYIDSDSRKLIDTQFEFTEEDNRGVEKLPPEHPHYQKRCARPHKLRVLRSGKWAGKTFYIMYRVGDGITIRHAWFHAPSKEVSDVYERLSEKYKNMIIADAGEAFTTMALKNLSSKPPAIIAQEIFSLPLKQREVYLKPAKTKQSQHFFKVKVDAIRAHYNIGQDNAVKVRTLLLEMGRKVK